jgi:hypothetical protein
MQLEVAQRTVEIDTEHHYVPASTDSDAAITAEATTLPRCSC